jgi:TPR repeat protein
MSEVIKMGLFEKYAESIAVKDLNPQSYNECEQLYSSGNYEKALESCLRYTMTADDARIWTMIGNMYRFGYGCTANQEEAFTWLSKAAMARVPEAEYQLWQMYRDGDGVTQDPSEALMWLTKAANHKYGEAALDLADIYTIGDLVNADQEKAIQYYKIAANAGLPYAECSLGIYFFSKCNNNVCYYYQAIKWFKRAAKHGLYDAYYNLAQVYLQNRFPGRNLNEYVTNLDLAAREGVEIAILEMGNAYFDGMGVECDFKKAMEYYENPLLADNVDAQKKLGYIYEVGLEVKADPEKSREYYQKAADHGSSFACYKIGSYNYKKGKKDLALTYYQKAADKNYPPALAKLADFYFLGEGTAVDHQKSYYNAYFASCLGVPKFNDVSKYKIGLREDEIKQIEQEIDQLIS